MTAPLPMRFFNPIKDLCQKVNLDYETVIATGGLCTTTRNALINAEIAKPIQEYTNEERKLVKEKIKEFNSKYGIHGRDVEVGDGKVTVRDKGIERYTMGATVEHVRPDDSKVDESSSVLPSTSDEKSTEPIIAGATGPIPLIASMYSKDAIKFLRPQNAKWVPGNAQSKML
jgi:hypothetical protein